MAQATAGYCPKCDKWVWAADGGVCPAHGATLALRHTAKRGLFIHSAVPPQPSSAALVEGACARMWAVDGTSADWAERRAKLGEQVQRFLIADHEGSYTCAALYAQALDRPGAAGESARAC